MLRFGIDWVSVLVLAAAFVFARRKATRERQRLWAFAVAAGFVGLWRLRYGDVGYNLLWVGAAFVIAFMYTVRAIQTPDR